MFTSKIFNLCDLIAVKLGKFGHLVVEEFNLRSVYLGGKPQEASGIKCRRHHLTGCISASSERLISMK